MELETKKPPKTPGELEAFKVDLCKNLKRSTTPECPIGGQSCGIWRGIKLTCEYTGFEIKVEHYHSQLSNYNLGLLLYKLYLDETLVL